MTYADKLKDPRWQKRRLAIMERDGWQCANCHEAKMTLAVHHRIYYEGRDPWEYDDGLLVTLCERCHDHEHKCRTEVEECAGRMLLAEGFSAYDAGRMLVSIARLVNYPFPWPRFVTIKFLVWLLSGEAETAVILNDAFTAFAEKAKRAVKDAGKP